MNKTQNILQVTDVSKSYGSRMALDTVTLAVNAGEFVALLGLNGAGKTTLFQLLTGLFAANDGDIEIEQHDIRMSAVKALACIGVVFQQSTLDLDLSVRANLRFHCRLHGIPRSRATDRITTELSRLGLTERADEPVRSLSGGNRRKVELARALLHEPRVLLMDEATVGLDPASRRMLVDYVHELCVRRGVGVLWATHLVDEADSADHVLILHEGRLLAEGTPALLIEQTGGGSLSDAFLQLTGIDPEKQQQPQ